MIRELTDSATSLRLHEQILGCNVTVLKKCRFHHLVLIESESRWVIHWWDERVEYCALGSKGHDEGWELLFWTWMRCTQQASSCLYFPEALDSRGLTVCE